MAQYIISVFHDPGVHAAGAYESPAQQAEAITRVEMFNKKLMEKDAFVFACGLTPPEDARRVEKVVSEHDGAVVTAYSVADGPVGSGPFVGGFWVIEAPDHEAAEDLARAASEACGQGVELRRLQG
ncbi:YciI family protein [Corynebacterium epidermidicanis]|uniref:Uncharacterized protein n=1 Tax=Corynebacterium epidermidicanis TaxID=1050174 RepID=A0A0G3GSD9_9CORY|nr:YciI family protein [Corynebacterium epidermidicanis]AKK04091.1 hypothetical protein CEPID_11310 [Corynebacterium epidermidicanis]